MLKTKSMVVSNKFSYLIPLISKLKVALIEYSCLAPSITLTFKTISAKNDVLIKISWPHDFKAS